MDLDNDRLYCDELYRLLSDNDIKNQKIVQFKSSNDRITKATLKIINNLEECCISLASISKLVSKYDFGISQNRSLKKIISVDSRLVITNDFLKLAIPNTENDDTENDNTENHNANNKTDAAAVFANDLYKLFTDSTFAHNILKDITRQDVNLTIELYEKLSTELYAGILTEIQSTVVFRILKRQDYGLSKNRSLRSMLINDRRFIVHENTIKINTFITSTFITEGSRDKRISGAISQNISSSSSRISGAISQNILSSSSTIQSIHLRYCNDVYLELNNRHARGWHSAALLSAFCPKQRYGFPNNAALLPILATDKRFIVKNDKFCLNNDNHRFEDSNVENITNALSNIGIVSTIKDTDIDNIKQHRTEDLIEVQKFLEDIKHDKDKNGITIEKNITFFTKPKTVSHKTIKIINSNLRKQVILCDANFITRTGYTSKIDDFDISQISSDNVTLQYNPSQVGTHKCIVVFHFYNGTKIARKIKGICSSDSNLHGVLNNGTRYTPKRRITDHVRIIDPIDGEREPRISPKFPVDLKPYKIPDVMRKQVDNEFLMKLQDMKDSRRVQDYSEFFSMMIQLEELQWELDIRSYDMKAVPVFHDGSMIKLRVPGLAEKRPSVLRSDSVIFIYNAKEYRGYVWRVDLDHVYLKFSPIFHSLIVNNALVDVVFEFKRTGLRLIYQGLTKIKSVSAADKIIHPYNTPNTHMQPRSADLNIGFINKNLNEQQKQTVISIVGERRTSPFICFGPPGTGKTETLAEAIRQMHKRSTNGKILVMSPSNEACDNLLKRLTNIPRSEMFRLIAYNRDRKLVDGKVMEYSLYYGDGFLVPDLSKLEKYRVIVCTLSMASKLYNMGISDSHFDAFFIDEAGYSWEAEIMSVIGVLHKKKDDLDVCQRIVLAGDPHQLGPIVRSPISSKFGLTLSMIERLIQDESPYKKDLALYPNTNGYNPSYIVKLLNCYRCHPAILSVSNEAFYDSELMAAADPIKTHALLRWDGLINKTFPLIFHGIEGENQQENSSPSWFNSAEIEICLDYVRQLKGSMNRLGFSLKDIAIITPYNKQVSKLKLALNLIGCNEVACGSVETFQGQERKIIIISTVRSNPNYLDVDVKYNLGFVKNPKRFNVAITRAIALLIVVGSPNVLNSDPYWSKLLWHCADNNAYTGVPLPKKPSTTVDGVEENDEIATGFMQAMENWNDNEKEESDDDDGIDDTWNDVNDNSSIDSDNWELVQDNRLQGYLGEWNRKD